MTQVKINLNKAVDAQTAVNAVLTVQMKLAKIVEAMQHTDTAPNYKYLINYMVGPVGSSFVVSSLQLSEECSNLTSRLAAAGVIELSHDGAYAEISQATFGYMIEEKMRGDTLVIKGSDIRYKIYKTKQQGKSSQSWNFLPDSVQIIVTKLELTDEDRNEFRQRQFREAMTAVEKLGYSVNDAGDLVVV